MQRDCFLLTAEEFFTSTPILYARYNILISLSKCDQVNTFDLTNLVNFLPTALQSTKLLKIHLRPDLYEILTLKQIRVVAKMTCMLQFEQNGMYDYFS